MSSEYFFYAFPLHLSNKIEYNVILSVVFGCKIWYLSGKGEHKLRVNERKVLLKICTHRRVEVNGH
jgi:hypothetical protein